MDEETRPDDAASETTDSHCAVSRDVNIPANQTELDKREIVRLARLPRIQYDREREEAATRLGVRVATLDAEVSAVRGDNQTTNTREGTTQGQPLNLPEPQPCSEPVDGNELLEELSKAVHRYIACSNEAADAIALYVVFTHCWQAFPIAPRLYFTSLTKRCGKSTALKLIRALVPKPFVAANITIATAFRVIGSHRPVMILDEIDQFLGESPDLIGVLNAGHERGGMVPRLVPVGDQYEARQFEVWCPVVLAGIGSVAETLADRSIVIELRRRVPAEKVERLRADQLERLAPLASKCARWAKDHFQSMKAAQPLVPDRLNDRAADNWAPLIAIADTAAGRWPEQARGAAVAFSASEDDEPDVIVMLLADIKGAFDLKKIDRLKTEDILAHLTARIDRSWRQWRDGNMLDASNLATLLRPYGIRSRSIRFGTSIGKGYYRAAFAALWASLPVNGPDPPETAVTRETGVTRAADVTGVSSVPTVSPLLAAINSGNISRLVQ